MQFLWQRYSRSGTAPPWFYWLIAAGFAVLAAFAIARESWLVGVLALVMVGVTALGATLLRRATTAPADAPPEERNPREDEHER